MINNRDSRRIRKIASGIVLCLMLNLSTLYGSGLVRVLPVCPGDQLSDSFRIDVEGQPVPVALETFNGGQSFHIASFEMNQPVIVKLSCESGVAPIIRPARAGLYLAADGASCWRFTLGEPQSIVIELAGQRPLFLFALPPEYDTPKPDTPDVLYFGPGVHEAGPLQLKSGQTVYLAAGAVLKGRLYGLEVQDVVIRGRGVLDARGYTSRDKKLHGILFERSHNIKIDGIQLRTGDWWQCLFVLSDDIHISRLHTLSFGVNNDGIDTDGVSRLRVEDCFIGCGDDGFGWHAVDAMAFGEPHTRDCVAERCVIWNEHAGNGLRLGASMETGIFENIIFRDIDVLHVCSGGVAIMSDHSDWAHLRNVLFENFHNDTSNGLMRLMVEKTRYSNSTGYRDERGQISDIYFNNVTSNSTQVVLRGADSSHGIQNLWFSHCELGGKALVDTRGFEMNPFVSNIQIVDQMLPFKSYPAVSSKCYAPSELIIDDNDGDNFFAFGGNGLKAIDDDSAEGGHCHRFERLGWGHAAVYTPQVSGAYEISVHWGNYQGLATRAPWTVKSTEGYQTRIFDQNGSPGWHLLGVYQLDGESWVRLVDPHYVISNGPVIADAVRFRKVSDNR